MARGTNFTVATAVIGTIHGTHTQYIRPDIVLGNDESINALSQNTRMLSNFDATRVLRSGISEVNVGADSAGKIANGWGAERSFGFIVVTSTDKSVVEQYQLGFYTDTSAVINGQLNGDSLIYLNSSTKVRLGNDRMSRVQSDLIQRLGISGKSNIVSNTLEARVLSIQGSTESGGSLSLAGHTLQNRSSLNSTDAMSGSATIADTLTARHRGASSIGSRAETLGHTEQAQMDSVCDAGLYYERTTEIEDNDLIDFILGTGSKTSMAITLDELRSTLGYFEFDITTTDIGDRDFSNTSELNTPLGGFCQSVISETVSLMGAESILGIKFLATNVDGGVEVLVNDNWLIPIRTMEFSHIDRDSYTLQLQRKEAKILNQIKDLILPRLMKRSECTVVIDINALTVATAIIEHSGTEHIYSLKTASAGAWGSVNIACEQLSANAASERRILRSLLEATNDTSVDHLS